MGVFGPFGGHASNYRIKLLLLRFILCFAWKPYWSIAQVREQCGYESPPIAEGIKELCPNLILGEQNQHLLSQCRQIQSPADRGNIVAIIVPGKIFVHSLKNSPHQFVSVDLSMLYRLKYSLIAFLAAERSFVNFSRTNGSGGMGEPSKRHA
jgi:hypothetical protein